jgi:hypothetical protein
MKGLKTILNTYETIRTSKPFGQDLSLWNAFEAIQTQIEQLQTVRSRADLKVSWSVGRGNWARVPWIAILSERETTSTQQGVYCVFLFREDMSGVYLALEQGITEPKNRLGVQSGLNEVATRAGGLRSSCRYLEGRGFMVDASIDLRAGPGRGQDYEKSTIAHKLYRRGEVPTDAEIRADIEILLDAYDGYLERKFASGPNKEQLEKLKQIFMERIPDFQGFPAAGPDSAYGRYERNYKVELVQIFKEEFEPV